MAHARYPRLERDLISRLYHEAQAKRILMTALASRLAREGRAGKDHESTSVVDEEPPAYDPCGRKE